MFKQIFQSVAVPYRLPSEMSGIPDGIGLGALYNAYLITPPRLFAEDLDFPLGFFAKRERTVTADSTFTLIGAVASIYWPGFDYLIWKFDSTTGAFIDRTPIVGDLLTGLLHLTAITQGFDGSLWGFYNTGSMIEYDPNSYTAIQEVDASFFGRGQCAIPLVDKARDLVMMPAEGGQSKLIVYTLSTGAVVRTINLSGAPINICAEDDKRVYVLCSSYLLNLVDYTTGEVVSVFQCPVPPDVTYVMLAYERTLRRLLVFAQVDAAADGSGQSVTRGFYPVPLATYLTTPIPLRPPRRGRQIPVLLKAIGDVGEPLAGVTPQLTATGDGLIQGTAAGTDSNGESIATLLCVSAGSMTVNAVANIDD